MHNLGRVAVVFGSATGGRSTLVHRRPGQEVEMQIEIWHNPRCSKSRATLALIQESGADHVVRRYLDDPPTVEALDGALRQLGLQPSQLVRDKEREAKELGISDREMSRAEWLQLMVENPILIERPVVLASDGRAVIGRPPEKVRELL